MSTYITVTSDSGSLVSRVKQVQQVNREAQLQRQRDTALEAEIANESQLATAQAERPIGGNPNTSIDRRPSAQRTGVLVGGLWWGNDIYGTTSAPGIVYLGFGSSSVTQRPSWLAAAVTGTGSREITNQYGYRLGSGNGANWVSSNLTEALPPPPETDTYAPSELVTDPQLNCFGTCNNVYLGNRQVGSDSVWQRRVARIVLPAGGQKAVVTYSVRTASYSFTVDQVSYDAVSCQTIDPVYPKCSIVPDLKLIGPRNSATLSTDLQYQTFCLFVDDRSIRPIALPQAMADYLLALNPESELRTGINPIGAVPFLPSAPSFNNFDSVTMPYANGVTPQVYHELNQLIPYATGLKTAADYKGKPVVNWLFDGGYKLVREYQGTETEAWKYAYDKVAEESPFGFIHAEYKGDPAETINLLDRALLKRLSRFTRMQSREALQAATSSIEFIPVFDWGDPAYCRTQLLALGFNSSDIS